MAGDKTAPQIATSVDSNSGALEKSQGTMGTWYKQARIIRKHPTIRLARVLGAAPILASPWSVISKPGAPVGAKELIEANFLPLRADYLESTFFGCYDFGWQPFEKIFDTGLVGATAGKFILKKLKPLLQDISDIVVDPKTGDILGLINEPSSETRAELKLEEILVTYQNVEGTYWYGESTLKGLQPVYDDWNTCNNANRRYDAKIAGAHWIVYYPPGKTTVGGVEQDNFEIAKGILKELESSGSFVLPKVISDRMNEMNVDEKAWEVEIKSAYPTSNVAFVERLKYIDANLVRGSEIPERMMTEGQFGTKAEAEAHADVAVVNMELKHQRYVTLMNKHGVNHVLRLNWGEAAEGTVELQATPIQDTTMAFLREVYKSFLTSPMSNEGISVDMRALRDKLGIPEMAQNTSTQLAPQEVQLAASLMRILTTTAA